jgi:hypothetical protein
MKLKTLLLSTAAAFAVAGGAQAADLTVAEPVDYVKVCDAAGVGYWYIPGTDTCLKIGGFVRFDIGAYEDQFFSTSNETIFATSSDSHWYMHTRTRLEATAWSMTDWGPLTAFMRLQADIEDSSDNGVYIDKAYLSIGPLLAGYTGSAFDYFPVGTDAGSALDPDVTNNQIRLTWAMNGFGLVLSLEDIAHRWDDAYYSDDWSEYAPDLVAALTFSQGAWGGQLSVGFSDAANWYSGNSGIGVNAGINFKPNSTVEVGGRVAWASDGMCWTSPDKCNAVYGFYGYPSGDSWSANIGAKVNIGPNWYVAAQVGYADFDWNVNDALIDASFDIGWYPVKNLWVLGEIAWENDSAAFHDGAGNWKAFFRLQRDFGDK